MYMYTPFDRANMLRRITLNIYFSDCLYMFVNSYTVFQSREVMSLNAAEQIDSVRRQVEVARRELRNIR